MLARAPETADDRALADLVRALVERRPAAPAPADRVRHHGLGPLAYRAGLAAFRNDFIASGLRAEQQRATAREAVAALRDAGIPVALLKGISYAGWLYDDPAERPMGDIDLLVRDADHSRAVRVLARLGYWHPGPAEQRSPRHHAMTLKRRGASVDLHRGPVQRGRLAIDWPELWTRTEDAPWIPGAVRLDPIDEILFHLAHLARQDLVAPLLAFVDAARMLERLGPHGRAAAQARAHAWRFARVLDVCLDLVAVVTAGAEPRHWWIPSHREVLVGRLPHRAVQLGRKVLLVEGPREALAFGLAVTDGIRAAYFPHRDERPSHSRQPSP